MNSNTKDIDWPSKFSWNLKKFTHLLVSCPCESCATKHLQGTWMKLCYIVCFISEIKTLCMLGNCSCYFVICVFFQNQLSRKNYFRNTIRVSNSLDPDQARPYVGPDQGPKCFQRLSAEDISRQTVNNSRS